MGFETLKQKDNIYYITEEKTFFSDVYIAVRKKENRILSDDRVKLLPYLKRNEWPLRIQSTERFINYIAKKDKAIQILDIGCGNGWFSNKIAGVSKKNSIVGLDVNSVELKQATRVFSRENLKFVYGNIFNIKSFFKEQFDIIILNGAVQYFPDFNILLTTLLSFLKYDGEIHIMDSPFYTKENIEDAKTRTVSYYTKLGFPEMASNYFHHTITDIQKFEVLYKYKKNIIDKVLGRKDSPFSWYCYTK
jgi:ubiquinone/menaquinone biosynthesis C-methylase UbiE